MMAGTADSSLVGDHRRRRVGLLCDTGRRGRYADQYETPAGLLEVVDLSLADPWGVTLGVVDTAAPPPPELWSRIDAPLLISPDLLVSDGFISALPADLDWLPLAPWSYGNDVTASAGIASSGQVGSLDHGRLSTGVGEPPHPTWETDEWWASSTTDALFGGLLVGEELLGRAVESVELLASNSSILCLLYKFGGGSSLIQTAAPAPESGLPWLSAELFGNRGRIRLYDDFAPGNIAVWDSADRQFLFPAVPFAKPNVQAADSSKGGWDIVALFAELLRNSPEARAERRLQARRLAELLAGINL